MLHSCSLATYLPMTAKAKEVGAQSEEDMLHACKAGCELTTHASFSCVLSLSARVRLFGSEEVGLDGNPWHSIRLLDHPWIRHVTHEFIPKCVLHVAPAAATYV